MKTYEKQIGKIADRHFSITYRGFNIYEFPNNEFMVRHASTQEILMSEDEGPLMGVERISTVMLEIDEYLLRQEHGLE